MISYGGFEHIVELKIWHGQKYREKGLEKLKSYLDSRSCTKGYLISFSFHKNKEYAEKVKVKCLKLLFKIKIPGRGKLPLPGETNSLYCLMGCFFW